MSKWSRTKDDILFGYESVLWDRYPRHVVRAFFVVNYDDSSILKWGEQRFDLPLDEDEVKEEIVMEDVYKLFKEPLSACRQEMARLLRETTDRRELFIHASFELYHLLVKFASVLEDSEIDVLFSNILGDYEDIMDIAGIDASTYKLGGKPEHRLCEQTEPFDPTQERDFDPFLMGLELQEQDQKERNGSWLEGRDEHS